MKLALFHYHLKPGGVTDVVVFSVRAILERLPTVEEVRLVTGDAEGSERVLDRIRDGLSREAGDRIRLDVIEDIGYVENGEGPDINRLTERLEARYGDDTLWWVHNYHLGKNPSFTAALMRIAAAGDRDMILQVHDFPECGRQENLDRLDAVLESPPYPSGPRIRYAVINERDRRILADAGLGEAVHLLTNPVPLSATPDPAPEAVRAALEERCRDANPGYIPGAPLLLYPVRAIRRKNILEASLLTQVLDEPANLLVTLPGVSAQEKAYSDLVARSFADGLSPGVWCPEATGDPRLAYPQLTASCDAVISTSVQEGFGYLFLNALHWKKPLLARYLDILDGVLDHFGDYPRRFWADFRVPADPALSERTKAAYEAKIRTLERGLPEKAVKSLKSATGKIDAGGGIDVSFLSVPDQLACLERARDDEEWTEGVRQLNRELLDSIARTLRAAPPDMDRMIEGQFGDRSYAGRFNALALSFGTRGPSPSPAKIREAVLKAFGRIDYARLLYDA